MRSILVLLMCVPGLAFAAGDNGTGTTTRDTTKPPSATKTTKNCLFGRVYDPNVKKCVKPDKSSSLDPETLMGAVREFAYYGQIEDAQDVLAVMPDQNDDLVLTYWGFTHRKLGNDVQAKTYYTKAIDLNPDNILARSYMGQGMIEAGDLVGAENQWREIVARGGEGTWAEVSLRDAIRSGVTYSY